MANINMWIRRTRRAFTKRFAASTVLLLLGFWFITGFLFPQAPARPKWADRAVTPAQRAEVVKDVFKFAWKGYYSHAFPNDELIPAWNWYSNSRNGWGATAVEALGTATIMEIPEIVDQILEFIPTIDFTKTKTKDTVDLFETTIRYMGGMLSSYELLTGPMHHLALKKPENVKSLLTQSTTLADTLKFAFDTPTGIPFKRLLLDEQSGTSDINTASSIGTLILEWTRLSELTSDPQYAALVTKPMWYLLNPKPHFNEPFPGIVGTWLNVDNGDFTDAWGSWGAGGDSFYEYLIKMYIYDPSRFGLNKDRWLAAADSTIAYIAQTPPGGGNLTILSQSTGTRIDYESGHLQCFAGGNFILGGSILNITQYIDFGLTLTESCHEMYIRTATGIGPETISWPPASMTPEQETQFHTLGFAITNAKFDLRPETVESFYYAYRVTKDRKYQDWAWEAFVAIVAHTQTRSGFSPITDVNAVGGGWKQGKQESFLFSELLKYMYLIFAEENEVQVSSEGRNKWVFNTEGHPLRISGTTAV